MTDTPAGWNAMSTAPKDGSYVLLAAPSGYSTTPLRVEVCKYDAEYKPGQPWVNHANNSFMDGGDGPAGWLPMPKPAWSPTVGLPVHELPEDYVLVKTVWGAVTVATLSWVQGWQKDCWMPVRMSDALPLYDVKAWCSIPQNPL